MKIIFIVSLFIISCFGTDIDGFRNMKWGDSSSKLGNTITSPDLTKDISYVSKKDDYLQIGNAKLTNIAYGFCSGKFCAVQCTFNGIDNFNKILDAVEEKYGKLYQTKAKNPHDLMLVKGDSIIGLTDVDNGALMIINMKLYPSSDTKKEAAKKGAKDL